ncbi:hypothetical protein ACM26V_19955 [Salipaludibacillus sp. HK11]|uniref:hypothetical protein n=1 Tax=Salipaludibacillus sp. HK11 TaxID=3394320 RepID=UPI0039FD9B10
MKLLSVLFISLSMITFRSCSDLEGHDDVTLEVQPVYSGGELSLTPYILYEGEEEKTFYFGSNIAWVDKIKSGDEILYEYDEGTVNVDQQTTLETDESRGGFPVELEVEPGIFEVHISASYFLDDETKEGHVEYFHEKIQRIEIEPSS